MMSLLETRSKFSTTFYKRDYEMQIHKFIFRL